MKMLTQTWMVPDQSAGAPPTFLLDVPDKILSDPPLVQGVGPAGGDLLQRVSQLLVLEDVAGLKQVPLLVGEELPGGQQTEEDRRWRRTGGGGG